MRFFRRMKSGNWTTCVRWGFPGSAAERARRANIASGVRLAWNFLFMEKPSIPTDRQDLVLVPDPRPPGDLASWRTLTYLPQDLPPFPPLLPEGGIN